MRVFLSAAVLVVTGLIGLPASAETNINFFLGQKMLDGDADPAENQIEFGATTTFGNPEWPVQLAGDLLASADSETQGGIEVEVATVELAFGVRKIWKKGKVRPFVGGGLALISGVIEFDTPTLNTDDDDSALGPWIDAGVFWKLGDAFNLGFDVRYSSAEIDLIGADFKAGGEHVGLLAGWSF